MSVGCVHEGFLTGLRVFARVVCLLGVCTNHLSLGCLHDSLSLECLHKGFCLQGACTKVSVCRVFAQRFLSAGCLHKGFCLQGVCTSHLSVGCLYKSPALDMFVQVACYVVECLHKSPILRLFAQVSCLWAVCTNHLFLGVFAKVT